MFILVSPPSTTIVKRHCKKVDITSRAFIWEALLNCSKSPKHKGKLIHYIQSYTGASRIYIERCFYEKAEKPEQLHELVQPIINRIELALKTRNVQLLDIQYKFVADSMSKKERHIGVQSIESCIYDHIAVLGLKDLFKGVGIFQMASIPDRGQIAGALRIAKWLRDKGQRYYAQLDITKCYENINLEQLKADIRRKVANPTLVYLVETLLEKHKFGLSIGSYLSQWLCNWHLSDLYHFTEGLHHIRKKKDGTQKRQKLAQHTMFYMDDLLVTGRVKRHVRKAAACMSAYLYTKKGLNIKHWDVQDLKKEQHKRPGFIDMMGYRCHSGFVTIRRRIWRKTRRTFRRASTQYRKTRHVSWSTAKSVSSYHGYVKATENQALIKNYGIATIMHESGSRVAHKMYQDHKRNQKRLYGTPC